MLWCIPIHTHMAITFTLIRTAMGRNRIRMRRTKRQSQSSTKCFNVFAPSLIRPLIIGIVHGLSGSAAVALLVVPIIRDPKWSIAYLLVFGVGTIFGMMLITMTIASAFHLVGGGQKFFQRLAFASGLLSLCFGLFIAYQICIVNGLFTAHPTWTPK